MGSVRLSRDGVGVALGTAVLYATGVVLGYPLLVGLAIGGLAMLVGAVASLMVRPHIDLRRALALDRVTVGESARCRVEVRNLSRWPTPAFSATDRVAGAEEEIRVKGLPPRGDETATYQLRVEQRGRFRVGPLTVQRNDPLGLLRWARTQTGDDILWVHPKVHPVHAIPVGVVLDYEGRISENARSGALTFTSLRDYVPGDDPRRIHWRTSARTGTLIVRDYVDTTEPMTTVVLDTRSNALDPVAFEEAVQVTASVVRGTELTGQPVTLHVLGHEAAHWRSLGARSLLDRLAAAERTHDTDPVTLLETTERSDPGGALVVITGGREPGVVARLAEQRRRFNPVVVIAVLGSAIGARPYLRRNPGMAIIACRTGTDVAEAWNRMVGGEIG